MTESAWERFHDDVSARKDQGLGYVAKRSNGGVDFFNGFNVKGSRQMKEPVTQFWRDGFVGLSGYGGGVF